MVTIDQLRAQNNEFDKMLHGNYQSIMTEMVVYLRVSGLSEEQVERIRHDLLDMALDAQQRQVPLSEVFGPDYQGFCDAIIANAKRSRHAKDLIPWLWYGITGTAFLLLLDFLSAGYARDTIDAIRTHSLLTMEYPVTDGVVLSMLMLWITAFGITYLIGKFSFRLRPAMARFRALSRTKRFLLGGLFGLIGLSSLFVMDTISHYHYILFRIPMGLYLSVVVPLGAVGLTAWLRWRR